MNIIHLGGEHTVTGSCHLLQANGLNIMVDCGLAQGYDALIPMESWPLSPADIDYLFLTHAHIDHIGRIPELALKGFKGEIITSHATKALLIPMLQDAMGFSDMAERQAEKILKTIDDLSWGFEYNRLFDLKSGIRFKLGRAGHILGSCFIRFEIPDGFTIVFSGDLGAKDTPILCDPDISEPCDLLILESTYGDRNHDGRRDRIKRLGEILFQAAADGGKVFIPAFALGRTQELIYEFDRLFSCLKWSVPVFIDSPLGLNITRIYGHLSEYWDREAAGLLRQGDHPIDFPGLYAVERFRDHRKILDLPGPAVILAGSGMCTGGRIIDHLMTGLENPKNDIFFVGYQAKGTPGRDIMRYSQRPGGYVYLDGKKFNIEAKVHNLNGYSAHADQKELLAWVASMPEKPGRIKLVHGEPRAQNTLGERLEKMGYALSSGHTPHSL